MGNIADILRVKGSAVHTVEAGATVFDAIRKMVDRNVGSLLVVEGGKVLGIFTERDYLRRVILDGRTSRETRVREIMHAEVVCVESSADVETCMAIMTERRFRHLPVVDEGRLIGLVSIGDLVKHIAGERQAQVQYLTDYITGKYPG